MTISSRHGGTWLHQNYDKLILFVVLAGLFGSALFLVLEIARVSQDLLQGRLDKPLVAPKEVKPADLTDFDAAAKALTDPFKSRPYGGAMMVSALRVSCPECGKPIEFSATKCPFCGAGPLKPPTDDADSDGLPNAFETSHGLNPYNPDDAAQDNDRDGFSNLEEYQSSTDLADPADYPSPAAKLRFVRIIPNPFKLRFQGDAKLSDGSLRYQLNLRTLERTYFVGVGDEIEGFKVEEYIPDAPEGPVIILKQGEQRIRLVKGRAITQYEMVADLVFLIDRSTYRVRVGDAVKIKDHEYKVIDIMRNGVKIRDIRTGKDTLVGPLSDSERNLLVGGPEVAAPPGGMMPGTPRPLR